MSYSQRLIIAGLCLVILNILPVGRTPAHAGDYLNSAHGSSSYGVNRSAMISGATPYTTGNCGHCHEQHASLAGSEPAPVDGGPSEFALFTRNFNTAAVDGSYLDSDNFCFYCHSNSASAQPVVNADYSTTFGGGISGTAPQYIKEAFNQLSFHNLNDLHSFVDGESTLFPWYTSYSNPCNSCHNPHLAKRNYNDFIAPLSSAIAKPSAHFSLWGETELMSLYGGYEAPYANSVTLTREPDGSNTTNGSKTPDYPSFCTDCHNTTTTIYSTNLGRNLGQIDWSSAGDKHGATPYDGGLDVLDPYATANSTNSNFLVSCLDCHEPHGSPNIMLLRSRVNGGNLNGLITSPDDMGNFCRQCHTDDAAANGGSVNSWEYIHHLSPDRPYAQRQCGFCHTNPRGGSRNFCGDCHAHGMIDPKGTGRKTF